ncbi:polyglutamine-binding protein 1-like [Apostichopus japonicus]
MPLPPALAARLKARGLIKAGQSAEPEEEIIAEDYSGEMENEPPEEEELQILLNNTGLPMGWWKVKDPKSGFFYFWDSETDKVKWTSPEGVPEPEITMKPPEAPNIQPLPPGLIGPMVGQIVEQPETAGRNVFKVPRHQKRREERDSRRKRKREDELDPMDPASYSDVPRGTWSTGLPKTNEAKTGVDSTATGPLFQMRPYPSPGAVLRANAAATNKEDGGDLG